MERLKLFTFFLLKILVHQCFRLIVLLIKGIEGETEADNGNLN